MHGEHYEKQWGTDGLFFTEAGRGGPLPWRVGENKLKGDALGPVRHVHDDADEYFYMFSGSGHFEVGGQEIVLQEGELGHVPPDTPHNFLGPASDKDACLFALVAPNFADNKWRLDDFRPGSEQLRMTVATPFKDAELPGGKNLAAEALTLSQDQAPISVTPKGRESLYLVVDGALDVALFGGLSGTLEKGTYLHVRDGVNHQLSTPSTCRVLRMDCKWVEWVGVPLAGK